ncbi:MAG TPA: prepilin peptidase [Candidatus Stackebrandtia faecavium]|nr:prepilin peptidase [Candidatus Stackebrandtia faecavium]
MSIVITLAACAAMAIGATGWWMRALAAVGVRDVRPAAVCACGFGMFVATASVSASRASALVPVFLFGCVAVVIWHADLNMRRIPDACCLTAYPIIAATMIVIAVAAADADGLLRAAVTSGAYLCCYLVLYVRGGVGFGDVKLAGLIGLVAGWLGAGSATWALILGFVVGAIVGAWFLATGCRGSTLAFGPCMLTGAVTAFVLTG